MHIRGDRGRSTVIAPKVKASALVAKNGFEKIRMILLQEGSGWPGQRLDAIGRETIVSLGHSFGERGLSVILVFSAAILQGYQNKTFAAGPVVQLLVSMNFAMFLIATCACIYSSKPRFNAPNWQISS